ncbi:MAG: DUF86 domain-containing protein [Rhizobiales bacterium]|nr:DUF86 domain-containing protein [Hyphomicrobiales bacterium]
MERDPRGWLYDARQSADAITRFLAGISQDEYLTNEILRAAVERHFEIIGEALARLARSSPEVAARIPDLARAVAFRNLPIHVTGWSTAKRYGASRRRTCLPCAMGLPPCWLTWRADRHDRIPIDSRRRVGKAAQAACPRGLSQTVGTLRFAHPTTRLRRGGG